MATYSPRAFPEAAPGPRRSFADAVGVVQTVVNYAQGEVIFTQGERSDRVFQVHQGGVKLSVLSKSGQVAIVGLLSPGQFFGEGCLAGLEVHRSRATALTPAVLLTVAKDEVARLLRSDRAVSDRFIAQMLVRNTRLQDDLVDQLFNSSERRLARTLVLLAQPGVGKCVLPTLSQETLAEMVGTTRSRVNLFLNRFRRLGFIEYDRGVPLAIQASLLTVVQDSVGNDAAFPDFPARYTPPAPQRRVQSAGSVGRRRVAPRAVVERASPPQC
jgi:CRP/FNR family transcriptional regulator, cyclic AMP receptor protein